MAAFLGALESGDGTLACTLMAPEERARRGGPACPVNVEAASEGFGLRRAEAVLSSVRFGRAGKSEFVLFLRKPRELAIVQMEIVNRHYFRLSYTRELFE